MERREKERKEWRRKSKGRWKGEEGLKKKEGEEREGRRRGRRGSGSPCTYADDVMLRVYWRCRKEFAIVRRIGTVWYSILKHGNSSSTTNTHSGYNLSPHWSMLTLSITRS